MILVNRSGWMARGGREALFDAARHPLWIGRPVEMPGSRPLRFECGADVGSTGVLGYDSTRKIALTLMLFTFYMSAQGPQLRRTVSSWFPPRQQRVISTVWEIAVEKTGGYVVSSLLLASLSAFRMESDGSNLASGVDTEAFSWSARGSLSYKIRPGTEISWFQFYRAPMDVEQGRIGSFSMANIALRQSFLDDKASLSVRLSDPFDQMGFRLESFDDIHNQQSRRKFGARAAFITFSYTFGQTPRIRQPRPQPDQAPQPGNDIPVGS